ncbi:MAG: DNA mismatch repair endonuclease MutL, partial [Bacilli bacterium]
QFDFFVAKTNGLVFDFYIDDRPIFKTSGRGDLLEVISRIYSVDTAKKMIPVHLETLEYTIDGYIGRPEIAKSTRYYMITILNERNVYVPKIQKAICEAYSDHLFSNKFPFAILKIRVEHSLVDVNVHPSKREVRLSNDEQIADSIYTLIKDQLLEYKPLASSSLFVEKDLISDSEKPRINLSPSQKETMSLLMDEEEEKEEVQIVRPSIAKDTSFTPIKVEMPSLDEDTRDILSDSINEESKEENVPKFKMPLLTPIGQIHNTYIICQAEDGFFLVDQHAANERINYEKFEKLYNSKIVTCEPLVPLVINLNPSDLMKLTKDKISLLQQIGLEIESFGMNAIKVVREPLFIKEVNEESYIETLLSQVINNSKVNLVELRKHVIATMACKASIKAHDKLSLIEMNDLIKSLFDCSNPTCCPHGRPTIVHFSKYDIEKMFKRSGF